VVGAELLAYVNEITAAVLKLVFFAMPLIKTSVSESNRKDSTTFYHLYLYSKRKEWMKSCKKHRQEALWELPVVVFSLAIHPSLLYGRDPSDFPSSRDSSASMTVS